MAVYESDRSYANSSKFNISSEDDMSAYKLQTNMEKQKNDPKSKADSPSKSSQQIAEQMAAQIVSDALEEEKMLRTPSNRIMDTQEEDLQTTLKKKPKARKPREPKPEKEKKEPTPKKERAKPGRKPKVSIQNVNPAEQLGDSAQIVPICGKTSNPRSTRKSSIAAEEQMEMDVMEPSFGQATGNMGQYSLVNCENYSNFDNQPFQIYFTFEV